MAKSKLKTKYIVIPLLVLSLAGGAFTASLADSSSSDTVKVASVSSLDYSWVMNMGSGASGGGEFMGTLKKGSVQNVKLNDELKISEVRVKKGDKLFTYDLDSLKFLLADEENALSTVENELKVANNELAVLKKLQPSENMTTTTTVTVPEEPEVETPDEPLADTDTITDMDTDIPAEFVYEKRITEKSQPAQGSGTPEEPFEFYVGEDTVAAKEYLTSLHPEDSDALYAIFYVCSETGTPLYARLVDGNKIDVEKAEDWNVNDGVTADKNGGFSFDGGSANFASFMVQSQQLPSDVPDTDLTGLDGSIDPSMLEGLQGFEGLEGLAGMGEMPESVQQAEQPEVSTDTEVSDEITEKDNYKYSKNELKEMIAEKEKEIEKLELSKRGSEINVKKAKKTLETGAEVSELDGTVTFVAKDTQHLSDSGAYVTVTSSSGMSVASSIGEFSISKIEIGTKMKVTNYNDGSTYSGEITSINDIPSQTDQSGKEDTTESYYEFVVTINQEFELPEDGSVVMDIDTGEEETMILLDTCFVASESGKYYVMVANRNDEIEKRYVTVDGKYVDLIKVKNGLKSDDRIALAYGKVEEGMKVVEVDSNTLLYGSSFF